MTVNYFAYGSNLCLTRLQTRVPGACFLGLASLCEHEVRWHKRSIDGSGKLSIVRSAAANAAVLGALFTIPEEEKSDLDQAEGLGDGYEYARITVRSVDGLVDAWTYVASASHINESLQPYSWYRDLVVSGATSLGVPARYVETLAACEVWSDPDPGRERRERTFLPCSGPTGQAVDTPGGHPTDAEV